MVEHDLVLMSLVIFTPLAFALGLLVIPRRWPELMRWWALLGTAATLTLSLCLLIDFYALLNSQSDRELGSLYSPRNQLIQRADEASRRAHAEVPEPQLAYDYVARRPWIKEFGIDYAVAVDGISMPLVVLTSLILFLAVIASWNMSHLTRGYLALLLILETGVLGAFLALDMFLFYVFYELMLIPMYFLIGIWGGGQRKYASVKFVLYTLAGSLLILVAMIGLYSTDVSEFVDPNVVAVEAEAIKRDNPDLTLDEARERVRVHTFDIVTLQKAGQAAVGVIGGDQEATGRYAQPLFTPNFQYLMFGLLFVGFAVKVPLVPLHNWLPDAHVEAPTPVSMILAGVLLKLGGYGILRFAFSICPWAAHDLAWWVGLLGCVAIVYGAFVAMGQTDFKRLLAYSSVSHMGYVILGFAAWSSAVEAQYWAMGVTGAMFQMVAHGITSAGLFFVVGVVYDRAKHRDLNRLGGLTEPMPAFTGLAAVLFLGSMAVPLLCGFVGEFFVMMSAWHFDIGLAVAAIATTVLTAAYLLWAWKRVFLGTNPASASYRDLDVREAVVLTTLAGLTILLGVLPTPLLLRWMEPGVTGLVERLTSLIG